jgi:hypothetical protein
MAETDKTPIRMRGAGYYSEHTVGAKLVIDAAIPLALAALAKMDFSASSAPIGIADFGAADGGTSIALHQALIAALRTRTGRAITLTHTDLPHNDFSALFRLLHGLLPGKEALGLADLPGFYSFASGTSFHRQVFPDTTLSFGFSATAMHWLSRLPAALPGHVHAVGASGADLAAFQTAAAQDWEAILLARARELVPGGRLVFANFCTDAGGFHLGWTGGRNMHATFTQHWRGLHQAGAITEDEVRRAIFPQFYRTVAEFRAPFDDPASPVSRAGLRLEDCFTRITPCPYATAFAAGQPAAEFARAYVPTLRSWSESMFFGALDPARPEDERRDIIDRFYAAYEADVAAAPDGHGMDYVHCFLRIAKDAGGVSCRESATSR